jgi:hypothetical protein
MTSLANSLSRGFIRIRRATGQIQMQEPEPSESTAIDVRVSVYPLGDNHPLISTFGAFEDEPLWDDLIRAMEENRRERHEQELADITGE